MVIFLMISISELEMNMFLNNLGHDVVIKLSKYGEEQDPINIIVPNGKTYYWPIGGFGNDDKDSIKSLLSQ